MGGVRRRRGVRDGRILIATRTPKGRDLRGEADRAPPTIVERLDVELAESQDPRQAPTRVIAAASNATE
ncbi:hypothetical protein [Planobispora takensis]|nr:hypothetical protein [Planobispora takensis]